MDKKRKITDASAAEPCKKPKLSCTAAEQAFSDEDDVAELANQFAEKCRKSGGHKVAKGDTEHLVLQYFDLGLSVVDEIALEGLDGITLEALWKRIKTPNLILNAEVKNFVWELICAVDEINCYLLNEPRAELVITDEPDAADIIKGNVNKQSEDDIYGFCVVNDLLTKTVGSSTTYFTRMDVTQNIKTHPLAAALSYGNKLVIVASQKLRKNTLYDTTIDPNLELTPQHYCLLERVGRSRLKGETNLQSFCKDAKQMFYIKKMLIKDGLVRRQPTNSNKHVGGAFTLARFHNENKIRSLLITEYIVNVLKQMPNYRIDCAEFSTIFDFRFSLKKFNRIPEFRKYLTTAQFSYREFYPDAEKSEWKARAGNREKKVRALILKDPNVNIQAGWFEELSESASEEDESDRSIALNRTLLNQAYEIIQQHGDSGVSVVELKKLMNVDFYMSRMLLRFLDKRHFINSRKVDDFRQHKMRYYVTGVSGGDVISRGGCHKQKRGLSKMLQLFNKGEKPLAEAINDCVVEQQEDVKLLSFGDDFSEKLRQSKFDFRKTAQPVEKKDENLQRFCFVQQNTYRIKTPLKTPIENRLNKTKKPDEFALIRSLLIEALISGLETIWPALRQADLQLPVDEVDHVSVAPTVRRALVKTLRFNQQFNVIMGPTPVLDATFVDEDGITVEIIASTRPKRQRQDSAVYRPLKTDRSLRFAKRANLVINSVRRERILTLFRVKTIVLQSESEEGYEYQVDKKSLFNVIRVAIAEGFIKAYKVIIATQEQCFICSLDVQADDAQLKEVIDGLKTKLLLPTGIKHANKNTPLLEPDDMNESLCELKDLNRVEAPNYKQSIIIGWEYGFTPKFVRMQVLHELLFYLVYDFSDDDVQSATDDWLQNYATLDELKELPPVHHHEVGWKMFIPPLPPHKSCPKGWTLFSDIILRVPLSLFVKMHRVKFVIPELNDYLNHPIKKHLLVKHLPVEIRSALLHKRAYMGACYENLWRLGYCGLLQFNRIKCNDKFPQLLIYVNRHAVLYDTSSSASGYNQVTKKDYKKLSYTLLSTNDLQQYWYQLWSISMNTPLGYRTSVPRSIMNIENLNSKPEMIQALASRNHRNAVFNDIGYIPGDGLGAAGLDSGMWPHLKYNWIRGKRPRNRNSVKTTAKQRKILAKIKPIKFEDLEQMRKDSYEGAVLKVKVKKQKKQKVKVPVKRNVVKKRVVYYDKIDKMILKKTHNGRARWTEIEDHYLGLCRIALCFLRPTWNKNFIPYTTVRDVFHRLVPESRNKTSRACQRRALALFKDKKRPEMNPVVEAENLLNSPFVKRYFKTFRDRMCDGKFDRKELVVAFIYLVYYLFKNSNLISSQRELIRRNLLTRENTKKVIPLPDAGSKNSYYKNSADPTDIKLNLIKSVIHSSLSCSEYTVQLAYRLYCIYQTFTDQLLKAALQELNKIQLLSAKKAHFRRQEPRKKLILPMMYHFSSLYAFMQAPDYPIVAYEKAREFLMNIGRFVEGNDCESLDTFQQGHNTGLSESFPYFKLKILFEMPEEALRLNPQINDHSELIKELAERYLYLLKKKSENDFEQDQTDTNEGNNETSQENSDLPFKKIVLTAPEITIEGVIEKVIKAYDCSDSNQREALQKSIEADLQNLDANAADDEEEDDEQVEQTTKIKEKIASEDKTERGLDEIGKVSFFSTTMDSQNLPSLEEIMFGMMESTIPGEKRKIPHISELSILLSKGMFPKGVFDDDDEKLERLSKHFVMLLPIGKLQVLEDAENNQFYCYFTKEFERICKAIIERIKKEYILEDNCPSGDVIENELMQQFHCEDVVYKAKRLINFVAAKREFGVTASEIKNEFCCTADLTEILTFLLNKQVILKVGVTTITFVHFQCRHNWFISDVALSDDDIRNIKCSKEGKYDTKLFSSKIGQSQPRLIKITPWVMINGEINGLALKKWCATVLSFCLRNPKVPFEVLTKKFCYLKPVDIFTILEYLQELGCITMMVFKCETKLNSLEILANSSEVSLLDDINDVYVNASPTGVLRMGYFLSVLDTEFSS